MDYNGGVLVRRDGYSGGSKRRRGGSKRSRSKSRSKRAGVLVRRDGYSGGSKGSSVWFRFLAKARARYPGKTMKQYSAMYHKKKGGTKVAGSKHRGGSKHRHRRAGSKHSKRCGSKHSKRSRSKGAGYTSAVKTIGSVIHRLMKSGYSKRRIHKGMRTKTSKVYRKLRAGGISESHIKIARKRIGSALRKRSASRSGSKRRRSG